MFTHYITSTRDPCDKINERYRSNTIKYSCKYERFNRIKTYEVEKVLLVGQRVWNLAFSPDQKRLYTTNGTSNDISLIDLESQTVTKSVGVGTYPWGVVAKP